MSTRRAAGLAALGLLLAVLQVGVVALLPWPGAGTPDLVVLAIAAVGLGAGPCAGMLAGFGGGLALDVLPPADHALGQWTFVLTALGALAGRWAASRLSWPFAVGSGVAVVTLAHPGFALLGQLLGDPRAQPLRELNHLPSLALSSLFLAVVVVPGVRRLAQGPRPDLRAGALR
ncbi:MAG: rod shape-determining protein MreD [Sporichthyaceae bacterium]